MNILKWGSNLIRTQLRDSPRASSCSAPSNRDAYEDPNSWVTLRCLDTPREIPSGKDSDELIEIAGWFAGNTPIRKFTLIGKDKFELTSEQRPDVLSAHPSRRYALGFREKVRLAILSGPYLQIRATCENGEIDGIFAFSLTQEQRDDLKRKKFERLSDKLQCPKCSAPLSLSVSALQCSTCEAKFERDNNHLNFLPDDLRELFKIADTTNVSANAYDEIAQEIIGANSERLILDCGAGFRAHEYPNVINFEIAKYLSTDVLGVNERLPFRDNTFDAAFSLAVLEHVKDPFASAREIMRVLKPGGTLYCVVPLLQPVHGYPHHYYNMTSQGLKNLFEGMQITRSGVLPSGYPIWTLTWFLRSWVDGLKGNARDDFLEMKVKDLIGDPISYLGKQYVQDLGPDKNLELASSTMLMAIKAK